MVNSQWNGILSYWLTITRKPYSTSECSASTSSHRNRRKRIHDRSPNLKMGTDNKPKSGTGNPDNKKRKQQYRPNNVLSFSLYLLLILKAYETSYHINGDIFHLNTFPRWIVCKLQRKIAFNLRNCCVFGTESSEEGFIPVASRSSRVLHYLWWWKGAPSFTGSCSSYRICMFCFFAFLGFLAID